MKPDELYSNLAPHEAMTIQKSHREAVGRLGRLRKRLVFETAKSTNAIKTKKSTKKVRVTGDKGRMTSSARYPREFTDALARVACEGLSSAAAEASRVRR